mmetsp:Transcript_29457/g.72916  ORF Transcript_29457/g.72916 Transcript_29457/m.72916 type:complete len:310 (-) Transcript_29457:114-1043(-)
MVMITPKAVPITALLRLRRLIPIDQQTPRTTLGAGVCGEAPLGRARAPLGEGGEHLEEAVALVAVDAPPHEPEVVPRDLDVPPALDHLHPLQAVRVHLLKHLVLLEPALVHQVAGLALRHRQAQVPPRLDHQLERAHHWVGELRSDLQHQRDQIGSHPAVGFAPEAAERGNFVRGLAAVVAADHLGPHRLDHLVVEPRVEVVGVLRGRLRRLQQAVHGGPHQVAKRGRRLQEHHRAVKDHEDDEDEEREELPHVPQPLFGQRLDGGQHLEVLIALQLVLLVLVGLCHVTRLEQGTRVGVAARPGQHVSH